MRALTVHSRVVSALEANYEVLCRHAGAELSRNGVDFWVVGETTLDGLSELTPTERWLRDLKFDRPEERIAWLQSCPPHFAALYGSLAEYSPDYIREIFHPVENFLTKRGRMHRDHRSRYVNVIGGYRHTVGQPARWDNAVFVVGNSSVYGMGCEDRHTLPSQLQALLNACAAPLGRRYSVFNLGARGQQPYLCFPTLFSLTCRPGDKVILHGLPHAVLERLRADQAFAERAILPDFSRRARGAELFFDAAHVAHEGQALIAAQLCEHGFASAEARPARAPEEPALKAALEAVANACTQGANQPEPANADEDLKQFLDEALSRRLPATTRGALVVNANPFTLGHQHLVEYAASRVDQLYVFVVEEDRSFFDFATRLSLVRAGTSHLKNVTVLRSGRFIMSAQTCPEYFSKEERPSVTVDASRDLDFFGEVIAPALGIQVRFVGEEPHCAVTAQHNAQMRVRLPPLGIRVEEVPRRKAGGLAISASRVRRAIARGLWRTALPWIPQSTALHLARRFNSDGEQQ